MIYGQLKKPCISLNNAIWIYNTTVLNHSKDPHRGELLVALLKSKADFVILQNQGWYRIPVDHAPKRWPPRWVAFYQPKAFKEEAFQIRRYGEVASIQVKARRELFPNEFESARSDQRYYQITFKSLETLDQPITSLRGRRLVFVPTTWDKFRLAEQINDLFDDSPLEDLLWRHLKALKIEAERQWELHIEKRRFFLDFAVFCLKSPLALETDGDTWHSKDKERTRQDYIRQNAVAAAGWQVLRFDTRQIREQMESYCVPVIRQAIQEQGGLTSAGLVPPRYYPETNATQLSLFEGQGEYRVKTGVEENLEL